MTAPAAAPASGPIAPPAPRASPQPPADRFAFAAVLDSIPGAATKAGASAAEEQPHPSEEPRQEESAPEQSTSHSLLNDGALLASLPFALRAASAMDEGSQAADHASSLAPAATKASGAEASGAPVAAGAKAAAVGRLIGERAFHFGASAGVTREPFARDRRAVRAGRRQRCAPSGSRRRKRSGRRLHAGWSHAGETIRGRRSSERRHAGPGADRSPSSWNRNKSRESHARRRTTRREADESPKSRRLRLSPNSRPPPRPMRQRSPAASRTTTALPDPVVSAAPTTAQTGPFGAQLSAAFAAGSSFAPDASTPSVTAADPTPRASALAASPAAAGPPVREIDVDLSPGGLEDVSMTMRLAGDKLSVVIRAASSQTLSSIEGARDAIADRMAAIGQPLNSLIVKRAGVNADGNANGNTASADDGSAGETWRSAQGAGERGGSNDASLSRRGAGRDRGL